MALAISTMERYNDLQKEIILLVDIDDVPVNGTLKLQKMVYFFSDLVEKVKEHGFKPHKYGPHSILVDKELQHMIQQGILSMIDDKISTTLKGKDIFNDIIKVTSIKMMTRWESHFDWTFKDKEEQFRFVLSEWKDLANDLTSDELLSYIYCSEPDMISDPTEYERLKPHFEDHITSMIKKDIISAGLGADLLGKTLSYMMDKGLVELSK